MATDCKKTITLELIAFDIMKISLERGHFEKMGERVVPTRSVIFSKYHSYKGVFICQMSPIKPKMLYFAAKQDDIKTLHEESSTETITGVIKVL